MWNFIRFLELVINSPDAGYEYDLSDLAPVFFLPDLILLITIIIIAIAFSKILKETEDNIKEQTINIKKEILDELKKQINNPKE